MTDYQKEKDGLSVENSENAQSRVSLSNLLAWRAIWQDRPWVMEEKTRRQGHSGGGSQPGRPQPLWAVTLPPNEPELLGWTSICSPLCHLRSENSSAQGGGSECCPVKIGKKNWGISSDTVVIFCTFNFQCDWIRHIWARGGHNFCSCFGSTGTDRKGNVRACIAMGIMARGKFAILWSWWHFHLLKRRSLHKL